MYDTIIDTSSPLINSGKHYEIHYHIRTLLGGFLPYFNARTSLSTLITFRDDHETIKIQNIAIIKAANNRRAHNLI